MSRVLTILEVSQKQAYIFSSNKLEDNIVNSAVIAYVLGPEYLKSILKETEYCEDKNMVYSGGGHTILEFSDLQEAKYMTTIITKRIYCEFDGLVVFAKSVEVEDSLPMKDCLKKLTEELERKKSVRLPVFKQGSFGIEKVDANTLDIQAINSFSEEKSNIKKREYKREAEKYTPKEFVPVYKFEELGGSKNDTNFIAVVHIDGNGMGKRVEELYDVIKNKSWDETKRDLRLFSEGIDKDFKDAYKEMADEVANNLISGNLASNLSLSGKDFPVRRIITAGDDICFVTEGRIGIECARIFIQKLNKKENIIDKKNYSACAGVAIVHQKYPFYRAYELAEMLCSNAKKYGAGISAEDNGRRISSIDWHIEFGELGDSLEEIRQSYTTIDGNRLELRPYIVDAPKEVIEDSKYVAKKYVNFRRVIKSIQNSEETYGNGKIKELRSALKKGIVETDNYLIFNKMNEIVIDNRPKEERISPEDIKELFTGKDMKAEAFINQEDGKKHSTLFDAIELMNCFIELEGGE